MLGAIHEICKRHEIKYSLACGSVLGAIRHHGPIPWDSDTDISLSIDDYERFCEALINELPDWAELDGYKMSRKGYHRYFPRVALKGVDSMVLHVDVFPNVGMPDSPEEQIKCRKKAARLKKMYFYKAKPVSVSVWKSRNEFIAFAKKVVETMIKVALLPISLKHIYNKSTKLFFKYPYKDAKFVSTPGWEYGGIQKDVFEKRYFEQLIEVDYDNIKVCVMEDYEGYLRQMYGDWRTPVKDKNVERIVLVDENVDLAEIIG